MGKVDRKLIEAFNATRGDWESCADIYRRYNASYRVDAKRRVQQKSFFIYLLRLEDYGMLEKKRRLVELPTGYETTEYFKRVAGANWDWTEDRRGV